MTEAESAARDLQELGIPSDNISVIAGNQENRHKELFSQG